MLWKKVSYESDPALIFDLDVNRYRAVWGPGTRSRLYKSTGFFFLAWAAHYFPFYLMGRQRFLHHYLPAHIASALVTGALIEFMFNVEPVNASNSRRRFGRSSLLSIWAASIAVLAVTIWSFVYFAPLTYGTPALDVASVQARKWLSYDLHFAK